MITQMPEWGGERERERMQTTLTCTYTGANAHNSEELPFQAHSSECDTFHDDGTQTWSPLGVLPPPCLQAPLSIEKLSSRGQNT